MATLQTFFVFLSKLNTLHQNLKYKYTEAFDENNHDHQLTCEYLPV